MKSIGILVFVVLVCSGCKKENDTAASLILADCRTEYLLFKDDIQFYSFNTLSFPAGSPGSCVCAYQYENNQVVRVNGGFFPVPQGTNLAAYMFTDQAWDSLVVQNNTITTYAKFRDGNGISHEYSSNPVVFYLDEQGRLTRMRKKQGTIPTVRDFFYQYSDNMISEKDSAGATVREFFFGNNNLVKVVTNKRNLQGIISYKKEMLFHGYDDKPNPFRYKYYLRGAFYRAFSANNWVGYTVNEYALQPDSTLALYSSYNCNIPFAYNENGYPVFGNYR